MNGEVVRELGKKINPEKDKVTYEGKILKMPNENVYILLNKPIGYVTTVKDQFNRPTVSDLINEVEGNLLHIGRSNM